MLASYYVCPLTAPQFNTCLAKLARANQEKLYEPEKNQLYISVTKGGSEFVSIKLSSCDNRHYASPPFLNTRRLSRIMSTKWWTIRQKTKRKALLERREKRQSVHTTQRLYNDMHRPI